MALSLPAAVPSSQLRSEQSYVPPFQSVSFYILMVVLLFITQRKWDRTYY